MYKKILATVLVITLLMTSFCFAGVAQNPTTSRKPGYTKKNTLGIQYKRDESLWKKYDDNIDTYGPDEDLDDNSAMFDARYVGYLSNELLKQYEAALQIKDSAQRSAKINEILSKEKMLYSVVIYRKAKLPVADQIKKDVKCQIYDKLGEAEGYVFYFGYDKYSDKDLTGSSKTAFKALYNDSMAIKKSMTIFKPMKTEEGIMSLKKLQFKLKDVNGNAVTESIFKQNKLTMVNIWGTYCGPCIRELPILQQLNTELKAKNVGIVGIVSDAYTSAGLDKAIVEKAVKQLNTAGVKYTNILPDEYMKYDGLLSYVSAIPTSFFVDSAGNIVGEVRIGDGSKEEYTQLIDKVLSQVKRKEGYLKKNTLGIEYKRNAELWKKYDDNIDSYGPDEELDENSAMFDARYVAYLSNELLAQYETAVQIKDSAQRNAKIDEILSKEKMLYSVVIYRQAKLPAPDQIKKDVKCESYVKLGESGGYVFYFGYDKYNDSDLTGESKSAFKELYNDSMAIKATMTVFKPVSSEEGIMNMKKLQFKLKDINGNTVTENIFKQNKLTMINIWGTYCGPCIRELPILQQLNTELKAKKVGVVGIVSDAYTSTGLDKAIVDKAVKQLNTAGVKYTNILPDDYMKYDGLLSYVSAIPTSIFVDSEGNIVGEVRIGDGTKEEYIQLINKILSGMK